jgi:enoyl-CoA hydratase/carnithine racemase
VDISMMPQAAHAVAPQAPILLREIVGSIALLTLNRPAARNSLSEALIAELHAALRDIHDDADVRAVVIAANGPAFSAGHDMKELTARRTDADRGRAYFADIMTACSAMMQAIVQLPKPVIAAVQGIATAAGCQLVASCDLAVASEAAAFATPGVDIGLFCSTPMVALSRNVPRKQAMEMLLTGEPVPATTARDIGLINRVVAAGTERDAAIALAQKVALKSAYTIKLGKAAFYRQAEMSLADAYRYAAEVMTENMMARDAEEGIGAFIEKREPKWQDK